MNWVDVTSVPVGPDKGHGRDQDNCEGHTALWSVLDPLPETKNRIFMSSSVKKTTLQKVLAQIVRTTASPLKTRNLPKGRIRVQSKESSRDL